MAILHLTPPSSPTDCPSRRPQQTQALGNQNDQLKANYEAVRGELLQMREKHSRTRAQLLEAVESRVEADQRTETMVHKWKLQLEARTRELEVLQAKLVPQDLDILRAKVQEELEVPHRKRVASLEVEVERHRQMLFGVRREYERCKVCLCMCVISRMYSRCDPDSITDNPQIETPAGVS